MKKILSIFFLLPSFASADVSTVNGLAIADVGTVNGLAVADVGTINGNAVPSAGGITILASDIAGAASNPTTAAVNTTGASILILTATYQGSAPTVSDSQGNTWTALTERPGTAGAAARIYYCLTPTTSAAHTFTISAAFGAVGIVAASGVTAFVEEDGGGGDSVTSSTDAAMAATKANALVVSCAMIWTSTGANMDNGFTDLQEDFVGGVNYGGGLAYKITATPIAPEWTWTGANNYAVAMASFE